MNFWLTLNPDMDTDVSIHIRHCWRMNLALDCKTASWWTFQSTFAIAGE